MDEPGTVDEFEDYLREQMQDPPVFRAAYEVAERRRARSGWYDGPLGAIETLGVLLVRAARSFRMRLGL